MRIDGAASLDQSGLSVAGAGDVNGDGRDDVIVGARDSGSTEPRPATAAGPALRRGRYELEVRVWDRTGELTITTSTVRIR